MGSPIQPADREEYLLFILIGGEPHYAVGRWIEGSGFYDSASAKCRWYEPVEKWKKTERLLCSAEDYSRGFAFFAELPFCPDYALPNTELDDVLDLMERRAMLYAGRAVNHMKRCCAALDDSIADFLALCSAEQEAEFKELEEEGRALKEQMEEWHAESEQRMKEQAENPEQPDDPDDSGELLYDDDDFDPEEDEDLLEEQREEELTQAVVEEYEWDFLREKHHSRALAEFVYPSLLRFLKKLRAALKVMDTAENAGMMLDEYAAEDGNPLHPEIRAFILKWFRSGSYWATRGGVPEEDLEEGEVLLTEEICDRTDDEALGGTPIDIVLLIRLDAFMHAVWQRRTKEELHVRLMRIEHDYTWWAADSRAIVE